MYIYIYDFRPPPPAPPQPGSDLFLACSSQLKIYQPLKQNVLEICTSNEAINQCAKKYMLSGASFDTLCEHNAQICENIKKIQLAEAWRMVRLLMKNPMEIYEAEFKMEDVISDNQIPSNRYIVDIIFRIPNGLLFTKRL